MKNMNHFADEMIRTDLAQFGRWCVMLLMTGLMLKPMTEMISVGQSFLLHVHSSFCRQSLFILCIFIIVPLLIPYMLPFPWDVSLRYVNIMALESDHNINA
jgi:hypothetical protein